MYLFFSSAEIPGSQVLKHLGFLTVEEVNGAFCYINEADFGRFLKKGATARRTQNQPYEEKD